MADLIPVTFDDGTIIYIQGAESALAPGFSEIEEAGAVDRAEKALAAARQLATSIRNFCSSTVQGFKDLDPDTRPTKATVEFGMNISLEGNVYVVKTAGEASIKITAQWDFEQGDGLEQFR